jgi:hypothetical protein
MATEKYLRLTHLPMAKLKALKKHQCLRMCLDYFQLNCLKSL